MSNITDTQEVVQALFRGLKEYKERAPDGFTKWEVGTMVAEMVKPLKDASIGIQNVHKELLGITDEDRAILLQQIGDELVAAGLTHRNTEISLSIMNWLIDGSKVFNFISHMPPTAEPV